ncbi:uncharacterized protein L969DRAFT_18311 [Mixia osmundae IAM 14324]|uniref:Phosphoribosylaminoimidazole carboxylase n=1 Tax=Mixia osmundae (strain CBS 9802 / IAM 14324 / JCM 22182 / KY 12970) TaxID=764103 RepID=G7DZ79_MIXOS|nr:uncharacterized protein L969DRAFT_18311 [Mixia osmundae IAM 14324]KEI38291.1 hypothetical protein L969DRAFT_18311 [Mixia osmundae IAM 14324]GAA95889.1 hypothetical protein E5Q_02547 [Mixia osmundae IAM 14324]
METRRIGVLGGGQLGRMLLEAGHRLNLDIVFLDPSATSPAKQLSHRTQDHITGSFGDPACIAALAAKVDVLTVEIEHVDTDQLSKMSTTEAAKMDIFPSAATIKLIQDKYEQKRHFQSHGIPLARFLPVEPSSATSSITQAIQQLGLPLMLKSRTMAYDGKGNYLLKSDAPAEIAKAIEALGKGQRPLYAEGFAPFVCEIAVMVVRGRDGKIASYPAVETIHRDSICHLVICPLRKGNRSTRERARQIAEQAVGTFGDGAVGIFGVEMFLMPSGEILVNEIAPRPHNSGHYTIEACLTSQYENHLRAILGYPLGSTEMKVGSAVMLNLLGSSNSMEEISSVVRASLHVDGATTHLYGKADCRPGRKMGHITVVGESDAQVQDRLLPLLAALPASYTQSPSTAYPLVIRPGLSHPLPMVGIIMGSDSDLPVMSKAAEILENFKVPFELTVRSAHRTADLMNTYAIEAQSRGLKVIIAGAGGAAHLPGMVASHTPLPVIGVPIKASVLDGVDSLYSIVQMPRGIPVATVGINNATNAALLAIRILGDTVSDYRQAMIDYQVSLEQEVEAKIESLDTMGWKAYMSK